MADDSGVVVRRADLPISIGKQTPENARKWFRSQVPYRNFAGLSEDLDLKVESFVTNHRTNFRSRMESTFQRWSVNWSAANGEAVWHTLKDDIHIPETKKAIDMKASRIEEGILDFDPVFSVKGVREDLPRFKAQLIESYVARLMDLSSFRDLVQPAARDGELCNVAAVKVVWEEEIEGVVERKIEMRFRDDGTPYYSDVRSYREAIARKGPRYYLVDPFWFFYDLDAPTVQQCEFIGDESEMFLHDLEQQAELGKFSKEKVKLVRERRAGNRSVAPADGVQKVELTEQYRSARHIAGAGAMSIDGKRENQAMKCRVIECWGFFDFEDGIDGVVDPLGRKLKGVHRIVATLANGICIRFQLNPYDKKFVPYGVCRINRNGHEMVAPAQFDHVVQMNALYDDIRGLIHRNAKLGTAPLIVTRNGAEFPVDTILGVLPGTILNGVTGDWDVVQTQEIAPQTISYQDQFFRREIEESSGALRVYEQPTGTATETERKVQEQQRMVRNSIRANGDLWRQVALITYWMSGQFASGPERFAVIGKASSMLGKSAMMTPDILQEDIDIHFVGIQNLHTFGNEMAGRTQWMNQWGPLIQAMPGVNIMALARKDYERRVGRADIEEIFPDAVAPWDAMPQEEENEMILAGHVVPVSKRDDDLDHIKKVMVIIKNPKVPDYIKGLAVEHLNEHMAQQLAKEAEYQAAQEQAQRQAQLQAPGGGKAGVDKAPENGGMQAQQKGVTPGPTQERTVSRTGRSGAGTSQSQAIAS